jgi:hypothetical protein
MTEKTHRKSRLHGAVARYRDARRSLHTPASPRSRYGLDWMNFFVADVQTGFGAFVAFYLAHRDWSVRDVGFVLLRCSAKYRAAHSRTRCGGNAA